MKISLAKCVPQDAKISSVLCYPKIHCTYAVLLKEKITLSHYLNIIQQYQLNKEPARATLHYYSDSRELRKLIR